MNETQWLNCTTPTKSLSYLMERAGQIPASIWANKPSDRQFHLISCAITRLFISNEHIHGHNFINDVINYIENNYIYKKPHLNREYYDNMKATTYHMLQELLLEPHIGLQYILPKACLNHNLISCDIFRDVYGNPFKPIQFTIDCRKCGIFALPTGFDFTKCPKCKLPIVYNLFDKEVLSLANAAYEYQMDNYQLDPLRLMILADALEEKGCVEPTILNHLRDSTKPHVKGCHILDLILNKIII
jgi:hypothetical protein